MDFIIKLKEGIDNLYFNMPIEETVEILGTADEVENIENAVDEETIVLKYNELGLTMFFEGENPTLACIDTCNEESTLFGEKIFDMDERSIVRLMVAHDYAEQDVDEEDWGERRITFPQGNIDFYFDEGELVSIIMGA